MEITRGKINSAQKVIIYGAEGIGKTSMAAKFPNPLFCDTEGSTKHLDVARTPKPTSWSILLLQVKYIIENPTLCSTFVIDTADWAEQLCITHICSKNDKNGIEDFGYGRGYTYLSEEFGKLLNLLEELIEKGVHVVLTAHAQMRKFEQPDEMGSYDRWEMKLSKRTAPLVKEWADMVLFANFKTHVINVDNQGAQKGKNKAQGGSRVMYTSHHPCWDAKNRHGLPDVLDLDFAKIAQCFMSASPETITHTQPPQSEPQRETQPAQVRYWYHPESECLLVTKSDAEVRNMVDADGLIGEISKTEYEAIKSKQQSSDTTPTPTAPVPQATQPLPKALLDLMAVGGVTTSEIQEVVASKGVFPIDMPVEDYPEDYIEGVLIAAWDQVYAAISAMRLSKVNDISSNSLFV